MKLILLLTLNWIALTLAESDQGKVGNGNDSLNDSQISLLRIFLLS